MATECQSKRLLHSAENGSVSVGMQIKVLNVCARAADWDAVVAEAAAVRERGGLVYPASDAQHMRAALDATLELAKAAAAADAAATDAAAVKAAEGDGACKGASVLLDAVASLQALYMYM